MVRLQVIIKEWKYTGFTHFTTLYDIVYLLRGVLRYSKWYLVPHSNFVNNIQQSITMYDILAYLFCVHNAGEGSVTLIWWTIKSMTGGRYIVNHSTVFITSATHIL